MKRLFLSGKPQCGKSTKILRSLGDTVREFGGFGTVRLHDKSGRVCGYRFSKAADFFRTDELFSEESENVFLKITNAQAEIYNAVFSAFAEKGFYRGESFVLLDEIGGVELLAARFREQLYSLLKCGIPCIGVLKSEENSFLMSQRLLLPDEYSEEYKKLCRLLFEDETTYIVNCNEEGVAETAIMEWMKENRIDEGKNNVGIL